MTSRAIFTFTSPATPHQNPRPSQAGHSESSACLANYGGRTEVPIRRHVHSLAGESIAIELSGTCHRPKLVRDDLLTSALRKPVLLTEAGKGGGKATPGSQFKGDFATLHAYLGQEGSTSHSSPQPQYGGNRASRRSKTIALVEQMLRAPHPLTLLALPRYSVRITSSLFHHHGTFAVGPTGHYSSAFVVT